MGIKYSVAIVCSHTFSQGRAGLSFRRSACGTYIGLVPDIDGVLWPMQVFARDPPPAVSPPIPLPATAEEVLKVQWH